MPSPFINHGQVIDLVPVPDKKPGSAHDLVSIGPAQPAHLPGTKVPLALPGVQLDDDVADGVLPALGDGILGHLVLGQADGAKARLGGLDVAGSDALDEDLLVTVRSLEGELQT